MNQARAILWAQSRIARNYFPRGGVPWMLIISLGWYGAWLFFAAVVAVVLARPDVADIVSAFAAALLLMFLYWQVIPLLMASSGASLDLRKLQAYPIPDTQLFGIEVMLRATSAIEMLLVLLGAALGIAVNPTLPAWGALFTLPFIAFNLLLALGIRDVVMRLMARRHIREILAIGFLALWIVPQLAFFASPDRPRGPGRGGPAWVVDLFNGNVWEGFPWTATAHLIQGQDLLRSSAVMAVWIAAAGVFALWQFRRTLAFDPQAAAARGARPGERSGPLEGFYRLPSALLRDPLGALAEKEVRYLARSPRFRMVFLMGCTFGLLITRTMSRGGFGDYGPGYLTTAALYSLLLLGEVCFWNTFGFDRSAAQNYFLAPVPFSRALLAKNIAAGIFIFLEILVLTTVYTIFRLPITPYRFAETFAVTAVIATFLLAIGNLISVQNARATNPQSSMRSTAAGRTQALVLLVYPISFLPAALAYLAGWAFESHVVFFGVLAIVGGIGAVVYKLALEAAAGRAAERREAMIAALSEGDGPITA